MNIFLVDMNEFVPCFQNLNGFQKRQARHSIFQNICRSKGYNGLSWTCPTCGKGDHGQPTGHGFCISTSSVEHWAGLALDESDLRLGFDLAHRNAPQEANGIAELFFSPKEKRQRPVEGWHYGSRFSEIWTRKEALGKMHGIGIVVNQPGKDGGLLDSERIASSHLQIMLNSSNGLPEELIGCIIQTAKKTQNPINNLPVKIQRIRP